MGCPSACLVTSRYASLPLSLDVVFQGDLKASEVPLSPQCKQEATNGLDKPVATVSNLPLAPPAVFGTTDNPLPFENIAKTRNYNTISEWSSLYEYSFPLSDPFTSPMRGKSKTKHGSTRALKTGLCQAFHISEAEWPTELGFTLTKIKNEPSALDHTQDQGCWREQLRGNQSGPYSPDSNPAKKNIICSTNIYFLLWVRLCAGLWRWWTN